MRPGLARILYTATWLVLPIGFTAFLTVYDLRSFVASNSITLINIANAATTTEAMMPILMTLVTYYLNDIAPSTLTAAMVSAFLFKQYVHYLSPYGRVAFPQQALGLRRLNFLWLLLSLGVFALVVVAMLFPLARQLLIMAQIANALVLPAFIVALTGMFGWLGSALAWVFTSGMAILQALAFLRMEAIVGSLLILLLIFLVTYYCTTLALSYTVLPRMSAPLASHRPLIGELRRAALWIVGWFLKNGLDALRGPDAASIIADVVDTRTASGSSAT